MISLSGCKSVNGKDCVFPFKYEGVTYNECTTQDSDTAWCSNRVNTRSGIAIKGEWSDCEPGCPGTGSGNSGSGNAGSTGGSQSKGTQLCKSENGRDCVFPFKYKGTTYNQCTKKGSKNGVAWCANEVNDRTGVVVSGKWSDCDAGCPGTVTPGITT